MKLIKYLKKIDKYTYYYGGMLIISLSIITYGYFVEDDYGFLVICVFFIPLGVMPSFIGMLSCIPNKLPWK